MFNKIAEVLGTDLPTLYKSIFTGSTSTGVGYLATAVNNNWNIELHLIDIFWALITCILLTLVSLLITDCYKTLKKKFFSKKD